MAKDLGSEAAVSVYHSPWKESLSGPRLQLLSDNNRTAGIVTNVHVGSRYNSLARKPFSFKTEVPYNVFLKVYINDSYYKQNHGIMSTSVPNPRNSKPPWKEFQIGQMFDSSLPDFMLWYSSTL